MNDKQNLECKIANPVVDPVKWTLDKMEFEDQSEAKDYKPYQEIIGSLINVMSTSKPNICFTVAKQSQNLANPTTLHFKQN